MACPYPNFQWVTQAEIPGCRIFHSFLRPGPSRKAGSALLAFALAYQYVQKRATNQEKCPDLHFYVAHPLCSFELDTDQYNRRRRCARSETDFMSLDKRNRIG